jgi:hypothetical protein
LDSKLEDEVEEDEEEKYQTISTPKTSFYL